MTTTVNGTPSTAAERRKRILDIARDAFFRDGFVATTMSAIAAKVGGSKTTLYSYFPSKEDLLEAYITDLCDRLHQQVEFSADPDNLPETLTAIGTAALRFLGWEEMSQAGLLVIEESRRNPDLARRFYEAGPGKGRIRMVRLLQVAHDRGHVHVPDPHASAEAFAGMLFGDLHMKRLFNINETLDETAIQRRVSHAVRVFMMAHAVK
ncbi:TetR/AcrR family transcriptional regulator [Asticcacaulis sp. BYS171W]|uniref:TetR/AcrR family transcriptional regulator n=1 Tax=Asticcacaulis aquaticus TaxID=2984212 RepID=A0ABT5HXT0_9CAUL|nr:TetR/AcrR family transcriptional regulator [Asticcacaulis aquaticus]MDC7684853.1 TetR/AcrR family transcriptional regulator [Asticcacaulis aquaticus]